MPRALTHAAGDHPPAPRARRRGFSLVEIMIVLVLFGIIGGVVMRVITRQQRFYHGANQIMAQRSQLRQAATVLPLDLRGISSIGADLKAVSDSSVDFDMTIGSGIACEIGIGGEVVLPPDKILANGQRLTTFYGGYRPKVTDALKVYIYNDSSSVGNEEDRWQEFILTEDVKDDAAGRCLGPLFVDVSLDGGKPRPLLKLSSANGEPDDPLTGGPVSRYVKVGAPVRFVKTVRYALFTYTDGKWYLGFAEYDPAAAKFKDLIPVSGPYEPYASAGGSGLRFRYYTVDGVEVAAGADSAGRASIARLDLVIRAKTAGIVRADGIQAGVQQQYRDSLAVSVMLRNRT